MSFPAWFSIPRTLIGLEVLNLAFFREMGPALNAAKRISNTGVLKREGTVYSSFATDQARDFLGHSVFPPFGHRVHG